MYRVSFVLILKITKKGQSAPKAPRKGHQVTKPTPPRLPPPSHIVSPGNSPLTVGAAAAWRATPPLGIALVGAPAMKADAELRRAAAIASFIVFAGEENSRPTRGEWRVRNVRLTVTGARRMPEASRCDLQTLSKRQKADRKTTCFAASIIFLTFAYYFKIQFLFD